MPKKKLKPEELRIYVILAETVQIPTAVNETVTVKQVAGRLIAQGEHAVTQVRLDVVDTHWDRMITTINLSVRNSKELRKVWEELNAVSANAVTGSEGYSLNTYRVFDENPKVYGTKNQVFTAFATSPTRKSVVEAAIGHLELYKAAGE